VALGELEAQPPVEQDTGLACLTLLLGFHQIPADQSQLRHDLGHAAPADDADLVRLAKRVGAKAKTATLDIAALENSPLPAIVRDRRGLYFLVGAFRDDQVLIQRPAEAPTALTLEAFQQLWSGKAVFITTRVAGEASAKFDVTWFIPALVKYRWMLGDVLAASLALQLFALATPMIFQVVIDKVPPGADHAGCPGHWPDHRRGVRELPGRVEGLCLLPHNQSGRCRAGRQALSSPAQPAAGLF